jgi:hypothetical protein
MLSVNPLHLALCSPAASAVVAAGNASTATNGRVCALDDDPERFAAQYPVALVEGTDLPALGILLCGGDISRAQSGFCVSEASRLGMNSAGDQYAPGCTQNIPFWTSSGTAGPAESVVPTDVYAAPRRGIPAC